MSVPSGSKALCLLTNRDQDEGGGCDEEGPGGRSGRGPRARGRAGQRSRVRLGLEHAGPPLPNGRSAHLVNIVQASCQPLLAPALGVKLK